ncbi:MAG: pilus assembly protein [Planctomycetales bacterium]|nr:pilus assembly protein [Planctomycetales bacterium]
MRRQKKAVKRDRHGVATVELALVLPAFIVLVFGTVEICQRLHTKQSVVIAAYESCRVATRPISDTEAVRTRCQSLLDQQNVQEATIHIRNITQGRNDLDEISTGDEIRVRITVPWSANVVSRYIIADQGTFQVQAFMLRE